MRTRVSAAVVLLLAVFSSSASASTLTRLAVPRELKVVSYYPAHAGWTEMWTDWDAATVAADLDRAAALHANTVRAIIQPDTFGWPDPAPLYTQRLAEFVSLAAARGLHTQLTLFDWWYRWPDRRGSRTWARELLAPYAGDPRIAFVELRNEILPKHETDAWAKSMIPFIRSVLPGTPVTVSVAAPNLFGKLTVLKRNLAATPPDFYDIHYFGHGGLNAYATFARAKEIAAPTPLWIGETGYPTTTTGSEFGGIKPTPEAQEAAQVQFLATVSWAAYANGLGAPGIWQLGDLVPSAVPDRDVKPDDPELHYGLFRLDGTQKPATDVVRATFDGTPSVEFNNSFEDVVDGLPARWEMSNDGMTFSVDHTVAATGAASAEISGDGTGSYAIVPPNGGVRPGDRVGVSVWARRAATAGSVTAVLEWHGRRDRLLRRDASAPLVGVDTWEQLVALGHAPPGAAYVRVDLVAHGISSPVWFDDVSFTRY